MKKVKLGLANIYINKESGNCWIKDKKGESRPILYGVYLNDNEPLGLKYFMSLSCLTITEAVDFLEKSNAVLLSNTFDINFYNIDDVNEFIKNLESIKE